jgi:hypothetical protein
MQLSCIYNRSHCDSFQVSRIFMIHDFATLPRGQVSVQTTVTAQKLPNRRIGRYLLGVVLVAVIGVGVAAIGFESAPGEDRLVQVDQQVSRDSLVSIGDVITATDLSTPLHQPVAAKQSAQTEPSVQEDTPVRWAFYDRLPDAWPVPIQQGVYVDKELAARERPIYELQAASFRQWPDAQRLKTILAERGISARIHSRTNQAGIDWHQVVIGPFNHNSTLNKAQDVLVSLNLMPLRRKVN